MSITDQYGTIDKEKAKAAGYLIEDANAWISKDVDVLIPAAIEGVLTGETVGLISKRVKIVAEGANGPTTPEADAVLKQRGVFNIPDFLCNAGGVTCSYFEGVQNDMNFYWSTRGGPHQARPEDDERLPRRARHGDQAQRLHAQRRLHGGHRPRQHGDEAARLGLILLFAGAVRPQATKSRETKTKKQRRGAGDPAPRRLLIFYPKVRASCADFRVVDQRRPERVADAEG